jgi:hypothetical protein
LGYGTLVTKLGCGQTVTYTVEKYFQGEIKSRDCYQAQEFENNYRWYI